MLGNLLLSSDPSNASNSKVVKDLTAEQLVCLAGGPRLRLESVSVGTRPDPQRKERTKKALMDSIVDLGLATALWDCLSKQRLYFLSESFSEVNSGEGALKLLCQLIDGSQDCFLSLIDFLSQASAREAWHCSDCFLSLHTFQGCKEM